MAVHLIRSFAPSVDYEEGSVALMRILARRGCTIRQVTRDASGTNLEDAGLDSNGRSFTQFSTVAPDGSVTWVLDESRVAFEPWDALLIRELSAELGGFVVGMESSRNRSRFGFAVFFAGHAIEFLQDNPSEGRIEVGRPSPGDSEAADNDRIPEAFTELYTQLTGSGPSSLFEERNTQLSTFVTGGGLRESPWRPSPDDDQPPLALALFALVEQNEFAAAWRELGADHLPMWHWQATATALTQVPYVLLTRDGGLDAELCNALARRLDVPAAAVALHAPGTPFDWWHVQPKDRPHYGQSLGAVEFAHCLMPATVALGERPGMLRLPRETRTTVARE